MHIINVKNEENKIFFIMLSYFYCVLLNFIYFQVLLHNQKKNEKRDLFFSLVIRFCE